MAPKNNAKGGDKKGKGAKDDDQGKGGKGGGGGLKPATAINVRHILVCSMFTACQEGGRGGENERSLGGNEG